jgi:hypothetical protein
VGDEVGRGEIKPWTLVQKTGLRALVIDRTTTTGA